MSIENEYNQRTELLSELYSLRNRLKGELMEVEMAIMRENNAHDAKKAKTVTLATKTLLRIVQKSKPYWADPEYQKKALDDEPYT